MKQTTQTTETAKMPGPFIRKRELARRLNISPRTINNYMSRGWLPYYRLGRLVAIQESDVEVLLEKLKNAPSTSNQPACGPTTLNSLAVCPTHLIA